MTNEELLKILQVAYPDVEFSVKGDGSHFNIEAKGAIFNGLTRIKQQQLLNKVLAPYVADGRLHAVIYNIKSVEVTHG